MNETEENVISEVPKADVTISDTEMSDEETTHNNIGTPRVVNVYYCSECMETFMECFEIC